MKDPSAQSNHDSVKLSPLLPNGNSDKVPTKGWPFTIYCILAVEFCERFCFYGLKSVLALYFKTFFGFSEEVATEAYHYFVILCYFFPIVGALISDSCWGRYRTIKYLSQVYILGGTLLTLGSIPVFYVDDATRSFQLYCSWAGLILIAIGAGGIKPCVISFGADQFEPGQEEAKERYFKLFYLLINAGATISAFLTPEFRGFDCYSTNKTEGIEQFELQEMQAEAFDQCHAMAYGIPTVLMCCAFVIFMYPSMLAFLAKKAKEDEGYMCISTPNVEESKAKGYKIVDNSGNGKCEIFQYLGTIGSALVGVFTCRESNSSSSKKLEGFIIKSNQTDEYLRRNAYRLLSIASIFAPLSVFWAIFDQIGSMWTFQANELDGYLLGNYFYIKSDQVETFNSIFCMTLIPVWLMLNKKLNHLFFKTDKQQRRKPFIYMFLGLIIVGCASGMAAVLQAKIDATRENYLPSEYGHEYHSCQNGIDWDESDCKTETISIPKPETYDSKNQTESRIFHTYKTADGEATKNFSMSGVWTSTDSKGAVKVYHVAENKEQEWEREAFEKAFPDFTFENSAFYVLYEGDESPTWIAPGRQLSTWLIVPQYAVLTLAEILISVTALEFAYSQSSAAMKTTCNALWCLTTAAGNYLIIILKTFDGLSRKEQFLVSAGLAMVTAILFVAIASRFTFMTEKEVKEKLEEPSDYAQVELDDNIIPADYTRETLLYNSNSQVNDVKCGITIPERAEKNDEIEAKFIPSDKSLC